MTSDLQRIAQGLLHYLDSNPRLAADLRSAGVVCRELAGAVGELTALIPAAAASAHYLDAAARSCDQAAHLATQATATGRAWALSTLGGGGAMTARRLKGPHPRLPYSGPPDFDPAFEPGALAAGFAPGVHDPERAFDAKERAIADRLQDEGWRVDARVEDHTISGWKNPEAMLRRGPSDVGRVVEFKTPTSGSSNALKRNIQDTDQLPEGGELVIDGRPTGVTPEQAERAYRRVLGQPGHTVAAKIHIILGDGRLVTYPREV